MRNPFRIAKEKTMRSAREYPFLVMGVGGYLGATIALNAALYTVSAGVEEIARMCGVETTEHTGRLVESREFRYAFSQSDGSVRIGTFELDNGELMKVADGIVVTEGKFLPNMRRLEEGENYKFRVFGNDTIGYQFVEGKKLEEIR